jgi:hypothetical protein
MRIATRSVNSNESGTYVTYIRNILYGRICIVYTFYFCILFVINYTFFSENMVSPKLVCDNFTQNIFNNFQKDTWYEMKGLNPFDDYLIKFILAYKENEFKNSAIKNEEDVNIIDNGNLPGIINEFIENLNDYDTRKKVIHFYNESGYINLGKIVTPNHNILKQFIFCLNNYKEGGRPNSKRSMAQRQRTQAQRRKTKTFKPRRHHRRRTLRRRRH